MAVDTFVQYGALGILAVAFAFVLNEYARSHRDCYRRIDQLFESHQKFTRDVVDELESISERVEESVKKLEYLVEKMTNLNLNQEKKQ